jgi:hypothetical protein
MSGAVTETAMKILTAHVQQWTSPSTMVSLKTQ